MSSFLRRTRFGDVAIRRRPRAVWAAFITSTILSALVIIGVLLPVLTLIGTAAGFIAGTLRVPVAQIAIAVVIGSGFALLLLFLCVRSRHGALSWVLGVAAVISTLVASVWPLVAVALAGVDQARDIVPFIQELITRVLNR